MDGNRLRGMQYVQVADGVAPQLAPYLQVPPGQIDELAIDVDSWPEEIQPPPKHDLAGRRIPGDPLLVHVSDAGLLFDGVASPALVPWGCVRSLRVVGLCQMRV